MAGTQSVTINCETGEVTYRDLTDEEIAANELRAAEAEKEFEAMAAAQAKHQEDADAGRAKLKELGLTDEQIAALLG